MNKSFVPNSFSRQMMVVLAASFAFLLLIMAVFEVLEYENVVETAEGTTTSQRLGHILPILESINVDERETYLERISHCHDGLTISAKPYGQIRVSERTKNIADNIGAKLSLNSGAVKVGFTTFTREDFSYSKCAQTEMKFPLEGVVVSVQIEPGQWLNMEIHPHEWHLTPSMSAWFLRSGTAFLLIGGVAVWFVGRLSKPFKNLTDAAKSFALDLQANDLDEKGPPDVKRAIRSFNMMQRRVSGEMKRRTSTLAAISHDIRSPLTALRIKVELLEESVAKEDIITSLEKMDRITNSALDYLKGESRNEPKRLVDLGALVESECVEFCDRGARVSFQCEKTIHYTCRPDALSRAVSNLIENAVKYAQSADVLVTKRNQNIVISVSDNGPGISDNNIETVLEPFVRLSNAREGNKGGFGLGLAIAKAVAEGHDGALNLASNTPTGLIATLILPL